MFIKHSFSVTLTLFYFLGLMVIMDVKFFLLSKLYITKNPMNGGINK